MSSWGEKRPIDIEQMGDYLSPTRASRGLENDELGVIAFEELAVCWLESYVNNYLMTEV